MDQSRLRAAGIVCAVVALAPLVPWLLALVFSGIDRSWLDAPGALRLTIPLALGLLAIAFASHGMWLQRVAVARLDEHLASIGPRTGDPAGAGSLAGRGPAATDGAGVATAGAAASQPGSTMVVEEDVEDDGSSPSVADKAQAAAMAAARKQGKKQAKRAQRKAKGAAKREVRGMFRDTF